MMSLENRPDSEAVARLTVQGLCEMCRDRIERTAKAVTGVHFASWDMETKALELRYDPDRTSPDAAGRAIAQAGHDNGTFRAPDAVYEALPDCCRYRDAQHHSVK
jgi:Cu(I)/Ag(I) efflux system membrane fusion protein